MLPPHDLSYLEDKRLAYQVVADAGLICVLIRDYRLPPGYDRAETDLLLRLPAQYPDAQPDMFWCDPPVRLASTGAYPQAADLLEQYLGRTWQRFSRHLGPGAWQPGTDTLGSYLSLVHRELSRSAAA